MTKNAEYENNRNVQVLLLQRQLKKMRMFSVFSHFN